MKVNLIEKENPDICWIPIICLLIAAIILTGILYYKFTILKNYRIKLKSLQQKLDYYLPYRNQYISLKDKIKKFNDRYSKIKWEKAIYELGYVITPGVQLNELQLERDKLFVKGRANSRSHLSGFINNIEKSPYYSNLNLKETLNESRIIFKIEAKLEKGG